LTIGLVAALTAGSAVGARKAFLTPGWMCIPTTNGQSVVAGGTGFSPSCTAGTTATQAPTYISSGDLGRPEDEFVEPVGFQGAIHVQGSAYFTRSGVAVVRAKRKSVTVPDVSLDPSSVVLATAQGHVAGVWIEGTSKNVNGSTITIYLSAVPKSALNIGWFVID
jgi:hypothetical protein